MTNSIYLYEALGDERYDGSPVPKDKLAVSIIDLFSNNTATAIFKVKKGKPVLDDIVYGAF